MPVISLLQKLPKSLSSKTTKILSYDLKRQFTKPGYETAKKTETKNKTKTHKHFKSPITLCGKILGLASPKD